MRLPYPNRSRSELPEQSGHALPTPAWQIRANADIQLRRQRAVNELIQVHSEVFPT
jgi:hypothetical protein